MTMTAATTDQNVKSGKNNVKSMPKVKIEYCITLNFREHFIFAPIRKYRKTPYKRQPPINAFIKILQNENALYP